MIHRKAIWSILIVAVLLLGVAFIIRWMRPASGHEEGGNDTDTVKVEQPAQPDPADTAVIFRQQVVRENCFIVVSKTDYRLYVYEVIGRDTVLAAHFPVCYAKNKGQKTRDGDCCTPECSPEHPFRISEIKDASTWCHDFGDGRGSIPAYGHWFMRLDLSESFPDNPVVAKNRSIGIHGSTNNEESVPGNASEGCIRLRDKDIETLHDLYAQVGQKVIVEPYKSEKQ
jgi:lipoprotein-anchoring transpeptidase ErfK/SrfK